MHFQTDPFSYIGCEIEGSVEDAVQTYTEIRDAWLRTLQPAGLPDKDFRELYDKVAKGEAVQGDPGIIEQLNPFQRFALNESKKFVKRNNN